MKKSGIYKITSPTGRIYIGSSYDIYQRIKRYRQLTCKKQTKLYNSLLKYGFENHKFEIIEECSIEKLFSLERAWGDFYNVLNKDIGLNCKLPKSYDKKAICSEETKKNISEGNKNRNKEISEETRQKMSNSAKKRRHTMETKQKMSEMLKGKSPSLNAINKAAEYHRGRPRSEETKEKIRNTLLNRKFKL